MSSAGLRTCQELWIFVELGLVSCLFLLPPVQKKLYLAITKTDLLLPVQARVIASYHQVLLMTSVMSGICCLTLPVYVVCSCTVTTCASYLSHATISWHSRCPVSEVFIIIIWCFLMLFCRAALLTFPSKSKHSPGACFRFNGNWFSKMMWCMVATCPCAHQEIRIFGLSQSRYW